MQFLNHRSPARLLSMFVLLAGLPLGAMGWLGSRMLEQERELERQRRQDRLENAANELADSLSKFATPSAGAELPAGVAWILFDSRGVVTHRGAPLRHFPQVAPRESPSPGVFAAAELIEFQDANPALAAVRYRELSGHPDEVVRAVAMARLGSSLSRLGRTADALRAYESLATLGDAPVAGIAAEIFARRKRADLFEQAGDTAAASAERTTLATVLAEGRYILDRTTFELYREGVPALPPSTPDLTATVADVWPTWHAERTGREAWTTDETAFASVWVPVPHGTVAVVGFAATDARAAQQAVSSRRNLLIAGFGLMTMVISAAGYFAVRSLHRELSVARLQSDFVAHVSHEFRTPLTAMRHLTDLLESGSASADRLPHFYQALGKETRRLHSMVESLLDFGRIQSGRHVYTLEDLSMSDVAERVVAERGSSRVRLTLADAPRIRADREALVLAVQNLLDNAIKYSPESSSVDVCVEARDGRVGISVKDHGTGMSSAEQRDIRRQFVRGSAARLMNVKGTGIGLAIVEQVAKAHGGCLDLHSEPGRGSRFILWIPASEHG